MDTVRGFDRGEDLLELSAAEAVAAMVRGDITAERYAAQLLRRCAAGKTLNAFISLEPERVLEAARERDRRRGARQVPGPLYGLPIPLKDSINTRDYPTTCGTRALRQFRPAEDAPVVCALVNAGAIVLGKTNLHELSFGWTSNNQEFGPVRNPHDPARIPGGSSGGTAAAVAARMAPLGVGEDTEGSIRVPAALCGVAGFRPTTARYPNAGVAPISALFDQVGPVARSVADLVLFDSVVAADHAPLPARTLAGVRLGVGREFWFTHLHPEVERVAANALRRIVDAGAELVEADVPDLARLVGLTTTAIQSYDLRPAMSGYLERYGAGVGFGELLAGASADVRHVIAAFAAPGGRHFASEATYRDARYVHLPELRRVLRDYFASTGVAAIVFPTTLVPAPLIGEDVSVEVRGERVPFRTALARNIAPGSTAGLPGLVLPAGLTDGGLPVSLEFDAAAGKDRELLAIGTALEAALGSLPAPAVR